MDISVVIPVYNAEKYVRKAIESALQFEEVKEVVVIEDKSPDNALAVCLQVAGEDARVKVYQHPDKGNHGAAASRNLGIQKASCEYVAFIDADDYFLPNRFDAERDIFSRVADADGVYGALGVDYYSKEGKNKFQNIFNSDLHTVSEPIPPKDLIKVLLGIYSKGYFSIDTLTIKKSILMKMPYIFNERIKIHEDTNFLVRLSYYANLYSGTIDKPVANRGVHIDNRITSIGEDRKAYHWHQHHQSLKEWADTEHIDADIKQYIDNMFYAYKICMLPKNEQIPFLIKQARIDPSLFTKEKFYLIYCKHIISNSFLLNIFSSIRYRILLPLIK